MPSVRAPILEVMLEIAETCEEPIEDLELRIRVEMFERHPEAYLELARRGAWVVVQNAAGGILGAIVPPWDLEFLEGFEKQVAQRAKARDDALEEIVWEDAHPGEGEASSGREPEKDS